jgi:hypothetical protein
MKKIKVTLTGSKKEGYVLFVYNKECDFLGDMALQYEELVEIKKILNKKINI